MHCISTGKTGEGRTTTKKNLNSDYLNSSNYFLRLQSDCFGAQRKYVVPCSVIDNGNEDSESAILQFPHRQGYSLDLHMLDCCVPWSQKFFAEVFWGRNDKIDEKERNESLSSSHVSNLCDAMSFKRTRLGTPKQDKILTLLMPYSAKIRIFVLCFVYSIAIQLYRFLFHFWKNHDSSKNNSKKFLCWR